MTIAIYPSKVTLQEGRFPTDPRATGVWTVVEYAHPSCMGLKRTQGANEGPYPSLGLFPFLYNRDTMPICESCVHPHDPYIEGLRVPYFYTH